MSTAYPSLCPTRRSWTPGALTRRFNAINAGEPGSTAKLYATHVLEYVLSDNELASLLACYNAARGTYDSRLCRQKSL